MSPGCGCLSFSDVRSLFCMSFRPPVFWDAFVQRSSVVLRASSGFRFQPQGATLGSVRRIRNQCRRNSVKKIFFCLSLGVMCASLALAQDTATAPSAAPVDSNASAGSIQGCLSGSDGNYTLTQDGTNTTFNVAGSDSLLKKHVGHEVALRGQVTSGGGASAGAGASAADPSQTQP